MNDKVEQNKSIDKIICPHCGIDGCIAEIVHVTGYARISAIRRNGELEYCGETDIDWDTSRAIESPFCFVCLSCNRSATLRAVVDASLKRG